MERAYVFKNNLPYDAIINIYSDDQIKTVIRFPSESDRDDYINKNLEEISEGNWTDVFSKIKPMKFVNTNGSRINVQIDFDQEVYKGRKAIDIVLTNFIVVQRTDGEDKNPSYTFWWTVNPGRLTNSVFSFDCKIDPYWTFGIDNIFDENKIVDIIHTIPKQWYLSGKTWADKVYPIVDYQSELSFAESFEIQEEDLGFDKMVELNILGDGLIEDWDSLAQEVKTLVNQKLGQGMLITYVVPNGFNFEVGSTPDTKKWNAAFSSEVIEQSSVGIVLGGFTNKDTFILSGVSVKVISPSDLNNSDTSQPTPAIYVVANSTTRIPFNMIKTIYPNLKIKAVPLIVGNVLTDLSFIFDFDTDNNSGIYFTYIATSASDINTRKYGVVPLLNKLLSKSVIDLKLDEIIPEYSLADDLFDITKNANMASVVKQYYYPFSYLKIIDFANNTYSFHLEKMVVYSKDLGPVGNNLEFYFEPNVSMLSYRMKVASNSYNNSTYGSSLNTDTHFISQSVNSYQSYNNEYQNGEISQPITDQNIKNAKVNAAIGIGTGVIIGGLRGFIGGSAIPGIGNAAGAAVGAVGSVMNSIGEIVKLTQMTKMSNLQQHIWQKMPESLKSGGNELLFNLQNKGLSAKMFFMKMLPQQLESVLWNMYCNGYHLGKKGKIKDYIDNYWVWNILVAQNTLGAIKIRANQAIKQDIVNYVSNGIVIWTYRKDYPIVINDYSVNNVQKDLVEARISVMKEERKRKLVKND